jgi:hypothetical protein
MTDKDYTFYTDRSEEAQMAVLEKLGLPTEYVEVVVPKPVNVPTAPGVASAELLLLARNAGITCDIVSSGPYDNSQYADDEEWILYTITRGKGEKNDVSAQMIDSSGVSAAEAFARGGGHIERSLNHAQAWLNEGNDPADYHGQ